MSGYAFMLLLLVNLGAIEGIFCELNSSSIIIFIIIAGSRVICGLYEMIVLNCSLDPDPVSGLVIQWKINNSSSDTFEGVVTENRVIYINCSEMYNDSRVQCERVKFFDSSQRLLGDIYNLQIQGKL